jgi:hypothetical protein
MFGCRWESFVGLSSTSWLLNKRNHSEDRPHTATIFWSTKRLCCCLLLLLFIMFESKILIEFHHKIWVQLKVATRVKIHVAENRFPSPHIWNYVMLCQMLLTPLTHYRLRLRSMLENRVHFPTPRSCPTFGHTTVFSHVEMYTVYLFIYSAEIHIILDIFI